MSIPAQLKTAAIEDFVENTKALGVTSIALRDINRFVITCPLYVGKVLKEGVNLDDATTKDFEEVVKEAHDILLKDGVTFACGDVAVHDLAKSYLAVVRAVNNYARISHML